MVFGAPLVPLAGAMMPLFLIAVWGMWLKPAVGLFAFFLMPVVVLVMKQITKQDDQRLMQYLLRLRVRSRQKTQKFWGAVSYSPIRFKKRGN